MNIFDYITADNITVYYRENREDYPPFIGEELFPATQQLGLKLNHIKAARGIPVVLKASAFDVQAIPRLRKGFSKTEYEMPYFKESMYIDEVTRQELNNILMTGNQQLIDLVLGRIYADNITLLDAARARREMMRMMLLMTGAVMIASNGQNYDYDYGVPAENKVTAATSWSDPAADIVGEINTWLDDVEERTGTRPTRAMCNRKTWNYIMQNTAIRIMINPVLAGMVNSAMPTVSIADVSRVLYDYCQVEVVVNNKKFIDDEQVSVNYVPDDTISFFPSGVLGETVFGTTPAQSDLMTGAAVNVQITDTGVSVLTAKHHDPVNVETIVAQIVLPSMPEADKLVIADVA